jgi:hypothetical protein
MLPNRPMQVIVTVSDETTAEEVLFDLGGIGETLRSV